MSGNEPEVQGAALAQLVATFIAGHAPPLRQFATKAFNQLVKELVPVLVGEMIAKGRIPPDWSVSN